MGDYEEEIVGSNIRKIHYICGGNGLAAIYVQNAGLDTLYYAHTDYQGSLTALSLANGTVVERYAYDPWGNRKSILLVRNGHAHFLYHE
jgi:YD repeat-containing protein